MMCPARLIAPRIADLLGRIWGAQHRRERPGSVRNSSQSIWRELKGTENRQLNRASGRPALMCSRSENLAWQNTAYNQPPHPSYFLGDGMATAPRPLVYAP